MPTDIKIIRTQDFMRATPEGVLDLKASRALLKDIVAKFNTAGAYHVLLDTRGADARLATMDIYELGVAVAAEPALRRDKVALLVPPEAKLDADFFENVSHNRGADLRAFTDFETAIGWLIMNERS